MFERDNSITPDITMLADKNFKPAKVRKYKTLLLNGFNGNIDCAVVNAAVQGIHPDLANLKRVTVTIGLNDSELEFADLLKLFHGRNVIPVIKTKHYEDLGEGYQSLNLAKGMCNYLLRDPHNLDIPLIVFDFAQVPEACKFMNDFVISHHTASLMPIRQNQMEITRRRNGPSGGLIEVPLK